MDYYNIEWFALETNRDHSVVFEIALSTAFWTLFFFFFYHDGYSIFSKGFLPTVVELPATASQGKSQVLS